MPWNHDWFSAVTRILLLHNAYKLRGGEDAVVEQETRLLREGGHDVHVEIVSNDQISGAGKKLRAFLASPYDARRKPWLAELLARIRPDVVHVHNFFPLLTPAVHEAAADAGVAVVQTLHNYRTVCAGAMLMRDGAVCEKCLSGNRVWGVVHRCYRGSLPGSLAVVRMQDRAFSAGTWSHKVHRLIALTEFGRGKFVSAGLPAERMVVKPNFVPDLGKPDDRPRSGALFVGRISHEKGVPVLIDAWRRLPDLDLTIIGGGPDLDALKAVAPPNVRFLGQQPAPAVREAMLSAQLLVMPSLWYEGFPVTLVESLAVGLPVLASRLGAMQELIEPGVSGDLFTVGNAADLAARARQLLADPFALARMARNARAIYEERYTPQANLRMLEAIYADAISLAGASRTQRSTG